MKLNLLEKIVYAEDYGFIPSAKPDIQEIKSPKKSDRPLTFKDFLGQTELKTSLKRIVAYSKAKNTQLPHLLFTGTPGVGKTTLANIMANERGVEFKSLFANTITSPFELYKILSEIKPNTVIFLDEIHAIKSDVSESLYYGMEDGKISFINEDFGGEPMTENVQPFTLIGATTMPGRLERPLIDRFSRVLFIPPYTIDDLGMIISNTLKKKGYKIEPTIINTMAQAARLTPRIVIKHIKYLEEYMHFRNSKEITHDDVVKCFIKEKIHPLGLEPMDLDYLTVLNKFFEKGAGLKTITSSLMTDKKTVENTIEPFLLKHNMIEITTRGRKITPNGLKALKLNFNKQETPQ